MGGFLTKLDRKGSRSSLLGAELVVQSAPKPPEVERSDGDEGVGENSPLLTTKQAID
jgi:hypothetical protein